MAALPALTDAAAIAAASGGAVDAEDPRIGPLIDGATKAIRRFCRWHVAPVIDDVQVLDHLGGRLVQLRSLNVVEVTGVDVRSGAMSSDPWVPLAGAWRTSGRTGQLKLDSAAPAGFEAVRVTMRHGFEPDAVEDLIAIVTQVVLVALSSPMGATREQAGSVSYTWATTSPGVSGGLALLERDLATLRAYRIGTRSSS